MINRLNMTHDHLIREKWTIFESVQEKSGGKKGKN